VLSGIKKATKERFLAYKEKLLTNIASLLSVTLLSMAEIS